MKYNYLDIVCGPMFAGKTTHLVSILEDMPRDKRLFTLIVKPAKDTRYTKGAIVSHDGASETCEVVKDSSELRELLARAFMPDILIIDEVQFFDYGIVPLMDELAHELGIYVICAGLDMDADGKPFGPMPDLLAIADNVTKLHNTCSICGNSGTRSQSLTGDKAVGGAESYAPRCNAHWQKSVDELKMY